MFIVWLANAINGNHLKHPYMDVNNPWIYQESPRSDWFLINPLTYYGREKMAAIFQTTVANAFSWMKMFKFWVRFHWSSCQWIGAGQATSHYLNQWWLVYWHIYASLGLNVLVYKTYRRTHRNHQLRKNQHIDIASLENIVVPNRIFDKYTWIVPNGIFHQFNHTVLPKVLKVITLPVVSCDKFGDVIGCITIYEEFDHSNKHPNLFRNMKNILTIADNK